MKKEILTDEAIREFLLGRMSEEERHRIELIFLTDSAIKERIMIAEQSLVDDYLEGSLADNDKESFRLQYSQTPAQKEVLELARFTQESLAKRVSNYQQIVEPKTSFWSCLATPRFFVPVAITVVIVIVLGVFWLNWQRTRERHLAVEREMAQLNTPESVKQNPAQYVLGLAPVNNRGIGPQTELVQRVGLSVVELRLRLIQTEAVRYSAKLQRVDGTEIFSVNNLQIDNDHTVPLRLPVAGLVKGLYKLTLTGTTAEGTTSSIHEYQFTVRAE